ncbi:hypothetical protein BS47DRAFT_894179 [Hydnum rufescens UP504]|uniref:Uncharacterized protein n=1 Tax=Hydnum rufescens UP504 TaxID=1448309 RepID=A0A9P6DUG7_9AGAM|nr:hypothetical protein BS47DRAFT_894179 [Hydnum rufescens UP504]
MRNPTGSASFHPSTGAGTRLSAALCRREIRASLTSRIKDTRRHGTHGRVAIFLISHSIRVSWELTYSKLSISRPCKTISGITSVSSFLAHHMSINSSSSGTESQYKQMNCYLSVLSL